MKAYRVTLVCAEELCSEVVVADSVESARAKCFEEFKMSNTKILSVSPFKPIEVAHLLLERFVTRKYRYAVVRITKSGKASKTRLGLLSVTETEKKAFELAAYLMAVNPGSTYEVFMIANSSYAN